MSETTTETNPEPISEQVNETENQIQALLAKAVEKEQKARLRAFYWAIIPAALALILLMGTGLQMRSANQAVSSARAELVDTEKEMIDLSLQLDNTNEALETANLEVVTANENLTRTLVTLEGVTSDLVDTRNQLAKIENEYNGLKIEHDELQEKVKLYSQEIIDLNRKIEELQMSLDSVQAEVDTAINTNEYRYLGEWNLALKNIATRYPEAGVLLATIVEFQDFSWRAGGFSPDTGFDSPGFAAFVLQVNDRLGEENAEIRYNLREYLPTRQGGPLVGDLVFYEGGYTMFYFVDDVGVPIVIGMTPQGVLAMLPEFATVLGYGVTGP